MYNKCKSRKSWNTNVLVWQRIPPLPGILFLGSTPSSLSFCCWCYQDLGLCCFFLVHYNISHLPEVMGLRKGIEALIPGTYPVCKQRLPWIKHASNSVSIHPRAHGENMQLVKSGKVFKELECSRTNLGVVPHGVTRKTKMMDTLKMENIS